MTFPSLPPLRPGTHLTPEDGACLMELVSLIAGEPFSDHPRCTDPTLATIVRVVNDALSDSSRQALVPLAGTLVGRAGDPARLAPRLVSTCLTVTQQRLPALPGRCSGICVGPCGVRRRNVSRARRGSSG